MVMELRKLQRHCFNCIRITLGTQAVSSNNDADLIWPNTQTIIRCYYSIILKLH